VPPIKLTDNSDLNFTSTNALPRGLQTGLEFLFRNLDPAFKNAQNKKIGDLDAEKFPLALSVGVPGSLPVSPIAALTVQAGGSASLDLLTSDKLDEFLKCLELDKKSMPATGPFATGLMSFAFASTLDSGTAGSMGDFCFGLTSGREVSVTNYVPVTPSDLFKDAAERTISAMVLPRGIDDLRGLPQGNVCRVEGTGSLKFTAGVQYSIFSNPLAVVPVPFVNTLGVAAVTSGAKFQVSVEHSNSHRLTMAALGNGKVRLGASLSKESSKTESVDFSVGLTTCVESFDPLALLMQSISPSPERDLAAMKADMGEGERSYDLSLQIKSAVQGAIQGGVNATICDALAQCTDKDYLFVYEADLNALDATSTAALAAALKGDFTQMTTAGSSLAGIKELDTISTITLKKTNSLGIHLLGILNFNDVSSFVQKSQVACNGDTGEVVLSSTKINVTENNIDKDHLREILARSSMITMGAASAPQTPAAFTFDMVFFLKKAHMSTSDLRWVSNVLSAVGSGKAAQAQALLAGSAGAAQDALLYLSLDLDKNRSLSIFSSHTYDDFVRAGQTAMKTILSGDPDSASRMPLFSVDLDFWKKLSSDGSSQNILARLSTVGMTNQASVVDFLSIDWWAQAMAGMAVALAKNDTSGHAQKAVLTGENGGFGIPWALLATRLLAGSPPLKVSKLTYSTTGAKTLTAKGG
jgi:hypothetical protein